MKISIERTQTADQRRRDAETQTQTPLVIRQTKCRNGNGLIVPNRVRRPTHVSERAKGQATGTSQKQVAHEPHGLGGSCSTSSFRARLLPRTKANKSLSRRYFSVPICFPSLDQRTLLLISNPEWNVVRPLTNPSLLPCCLDLLTLGTLDLEDPDGVLDRRRVPNYQKEEVWHHKFRFRFRLVESFPSFSVPLILCWNTSSYQ